MSIPFIPPRATFTIPAWMKNDFFLAAVIAVSLTAITYVVATAVGWVTEPNWLEIVASGMNYAATFLSIKQRRFFYLIGIGASAIYATVYGQAGLLASAVLSLYLTISLIYGYLRWGKDRKSRPVHHLSWKWLPVYVAVTAAFWGGAFLTVRALGGELPFWDAWILVFTILAQFMLDNKVIETWIVWTLVNIIGVILYFNIGLYFAAVQQLLFGVANLWGWVAWQKTMRAERAEKEKYAENDLRRTPVDNPLDYRKDGSIRPGDPAYDFMMQVMAEGRPVIMDQQKDGTWKERS